MLGQIRIDFILGVVFFSIVIFFIASQINFIWSNIETTSRLDTTRLTALSLVTYLVNDHGSPEDWENLPPDEAYKIKRVGFAASNYRLSPNKIDRLNQTCGLLDNKTLGGFRIVVYNETNKMLQCGFVGEQLGSKIVRNVLIGSLYGNITVEAW
ncbi:MAG TPA: hypothetical protein VJH90_02500 [archaeon]|nr:hypothetical protein [archaeon]